LRYCGGRLQLAILCILMYIYTILMYIYTIYMYTYSMTAGVLCPSSSLMFTPRTRYSLLQELSFILCCHCLNLGADIIVRYQEPNPVIIANVSIVTIITIEELNRQEWEGLIVGTEVGGRPINLLPLSQGRRRSHRNRES